jgi:hypothetical protein
MGTYTVTVTNTAGCTGTDQVTLQVTSDATERFVHKTFGLKMRMLESQ